MMSLKIEKRSVDSKQMKWLSPIIAISLTLITGSILFLTLGHNPFTALYTFFILPITDLYGVTELFVKLSPILLCAMGLMLCFRAKIWNIGAEGQFIMGGLGGGYTALLLINQEGFWVLPVVLMAGILSGLCWAAVAALLKNKFSCNEILTTIMLNYIALNWLLYAVHGPLKDPDGYNFPESALFSMASTLPSILDGFRVNISLYFALFFTVVIWFVITKTFFGFQISVMGEDASASKFAGFKEKKLIWLVLLICGALSGLAGVSEVSGVIGQLTPHISAGYGYAAIIVVYLGRMHPVGIVLASALLALTYMGGEMVQMDLALPKSITGMFQGMLLFYLLASDLLISYKIKFSKKVFQGAM